MTKLRCVVTADGRRGFPDVAVYEIAKGDRVGTRFAVPPSIAMCPDEVSAKHPPLSSTAAARSRAEDPPPAPKSSLGYVTRILDPAGYARLAEQGFWTSSDHLGRSRFVDRRTAPGA
ncbi:MAG: hypothetical protein MI824_15120 [Hyphomicrobiales bacterium]|nr:hypothetical protein [Hyphomicrobiales bacterium]